MTIDFESCPDFKPLRKNSSFVIKCEEMAGSPDQAMSKTYDQLANFAVSSYKDLPGDDARLWIGLAGAPGSGKSTVADAVVERIEKQGIPAAAVSMDGFHYTQAELKDLGFSMKRRGAPWTFDAERMARELGQYVKEPCVEASLPGYSREKSDPVPDAVKLKSSHRIIIVEGLYLLLGLLGVEAKMEGTPVHEAARGLECPRDIKDEIERWKPVTAMWNQTWYVTPPCGFEENKRRLIKRSLQNWTPAKTALWEGKNDEDAATKRVEYNDARNGVLVDCCKQYAHIIVESV